VSYDSKRLFACGLLLFAWAAAAAPSKSGWSEVTTPHVTVKTDLSLDVAERAAVLAERTRAALLAAAWSGAKLPQERVELVVFSDHQDFERYFGDLVRYKVVLETYPPTIFLYGAPERWEQRASMELEETNSPLKLALMQHLATFFYRRAPRWFSIGLAEFFETLRISPDGTSAILGGVNILAISRYRNQRTLKVADAMAWGTTLNPRDEGTVGGLEGLSWLMVNWMYNTHLPEFVRFQKLLVTGMDPTKAWNVVFPPATVANIDQELNSFALYGPFGRAVLTLPEGEFTFDSERPMTSAEVHATRAAAALAAEHAKQAQTELSAALADDPGNVFALRRQLPLVKPAEALALGRLATATHPDNGLAWLTLGDALKEGGETSEERAQAYKKATELSPNHPAAFDALAAMSVKKGRADEALPLALNAVRMAPWDAGFLDTLASALAGVARCSEAVAMEARAVDKASESSGAPQRAVYAAHLAEIQKGCVEAPQTEVPPPAPLSPAAPSPPVPARKP
jgi:tetratricopeptide (TPR) repeat protein